MRGERGGRRRAAAGGAGLRVRARRGLRRRAPDGPVLQPTSVRAHCSYAANSYFQRNSQANGATCDFGGTANLTDTDPSNPHAPIPFPLPFLAVTRLTLQHLPGRA